MDFRELDRVKEYMEIPSVFYSDKNSKPFSQCISCDKDQTNLYLLCK